MRLFQCPGQFLQCDVRFGPDDLDQGRNVRSELACGPGCAALAFWRDRTPVVILSRQPCCCAGTDDEHPATLPVVNARQQCNHISVREDPLKGTSIFDCFCGQGLASPASGARRCVR